MSQKANKIIATQVGDPLIRRRLRQVTADMLGTVELETCLASMRAVNAVMKGVGISANQVGHDLAVSMVCIQPGPNRPDLEHGVERIMLNPVRLPLESASEFMWEGCLSVAEANLFVKVKRQKKVMIKYLDLNGVEKTVTLKGFEAHIVQHELDHLDGKIFLDLEVDQTSYMSANEYRKMRKAYKSSKEDSK